MKNTIKLTICALVIFSCMLVVHGAPELTIVNPVNNSVTNLQSVSFQWTTNTTLEWVGYSLDGGENNTFIFQPALNNITFFSNSSSLNYPWAVDVEADYAFITDPINNSIVVLDISDVLNPVQTGSLINTTSLDGAYFIKELDNITYITSDLNGSLTIVNVTNKTNPSQLSFFKNASTSTSTSILDVFGGYVYINAEQIDGISIINVSDPATPVQSGTTTNATTTGSITNILADSTYVYTISSLSDYFTIINISNKTSPVQIAAFKNVTSIYGPVDFEIIGDLVYVLSYSTPTITVLNITDKTNPVQIASYTNATSLLDADAISIIDDYAFTINDGGDLSAFHISNVSNIQQSGSESYTTVFQWPIYLIDDDSYLYYTDSSGLGLTIFNVSQIPQNITLTNLSFSSHNLTIYGNNSAGEMGQSNYTFFTNNLFPSFSANITNSTSPRINEVVQFNITVTDSENVASIIFSWDNGTGTFVNITTLIYSSSPVTASINQTIERFVGTTLQWKWYTNDTVGSWNETSAESFDVQDTATVFSANNTNYTAPKKYQVIQLNITITDADNISGFIFAWDNGTGTYANDSFRQWSGTSATVSVNKTIERGTGVNISWKWYANDSLNTWNESIAETLIVDTGILINIQYPMNDSVFSSTSITNYYNVSNLGDSVDNCSLYYGLVGDFKFRDNDSSITTAINQSFILVGLTSGPHNWSVECSAGNDTVSTGNWSFMMSIPGGSSGGGGGSSVGDGTGSQPAVSTVDSREEAVPFWLSNISIYTLLGAALLFTVVVLPKWRKEKFIKG